MRATFLVATVASVAFGVIEPGRACAQGVPRAEFLVGYSYTHGALPTTETSYGSPSYVYVESYASESFSGHGLAFEAALNLSEHIAVVGTATLGATEWESRRQLYERGRLTFRPHGYRGGHGRDGDRGP